MKRALLIVGGTVGGLGAVLAITPPQFTSSQGINVAGGGIGNPSGNSAASAAPASTPATTASQSASAAPTAQQSGVATKTAKAKAVATKKAAAKSAKNNSSGSVTSAASQTPSSAPATQSATPTPVKTTPAPAKAISSGTFVGPVVNVSYGNVQVQITVSNGKITDATALQAPTGRSDRFSSYAVPILRQQTLAAQSDQITGASGASYTSYGWYKSLQGALAKAGL